MLRLLKSMLFMVELVCCFIMFNVFFILMLFVFLVWVWVLVCYCFSVIKLFVLVVCWSVLNCECVIGLISRDCCRRWVFSFLVFFRKCCEEKFIWVFLSLLNFVWFDFIWVLKFFLICCWVIFVVLDWLLMCVLFCLILVFIKLMFLLIWVCCSLCFWFIEIDWGRVWEFVMWIVFVGFKLWWIFCKYIVRYCGFREFRLNLYFFSIFLVLGF